MPAALEERSGALRHRQARGARSARSVATRPRGRPLEQPLLQQVGLVDVLDRLLLLVDRGGEGREPDRPAGELDRDRLQDRAVVAVEAGLVDLEQAERLGGDAAR